MHGVYCSCYLGVEDDGLPLEDVAGGGLHEQHGSLGRLPAHLLDVQRVVLAHADDLLPAPRLGVGWDGGVDQEGGSVNQGARAFVDASLTLGR